MGSSACSLNRSGPGMHTFLHFLPSYISRVALTFAQTLVVKLMRGSIRLVLRVLPISATPELAGQSPEIDNTNITLRACKTQCGPCCLSEMSLKYVCQSSGKDTRSAKELKDSIGMLTSDLFPPLSPAQEHVQRQPKTGSEKERSLEGSIALPPQAPASRLFQSILLHEQQEGVASEVSRRGGKTGAFHIPSPPNHDPADAALPRTDASLSKCRCEKNVHCIRWVLTLCADLAGASECAPLDPVLGEWLR
jgi:hypothetical protein